ncbi:unnamed protein product [Sphenostylis stenocarpa]|uniref:Uncharacterized protein n=1 Tax=Sphenostylis stenocarpa TaxID=92480 RepID=A0AA86SFV3_9FABA|nr:unnamed protein product [Sphenostylis stenocarpa]
MLLIEKFFVGVVRKEGAKDGNIYRERFFGESPRKKGMVLPQELNHPEGTKILIEVVLACQ